MKYLVRRVFDRLCPRTPKPGSTPLAQAKLAIPLPDFNLSNAARLMYQERLYKIARQHPGDIIECGVGLGTTLLFWSYLVSQDGSRRKIWGFDSFEGFPEPSVEDTSPRNPKKGEWAQADLRGVNLLLKNSGLGGEWVRANVTLVKGFFEDSLPKYTGGDIALLHIDADLYQSYKTTLEALYDLVVAGGVIAFDEYMGSLEHYSFPGASKAIDEFFAGKNQTILRDRTFGKYYLIKNG